MTVVASLVIAQLWVSPLPAAHVTAPSVQSLDAGQSDAPPSSAAPELTLAQAVAQARQRSPRQLTARAIADGARLASQGAGRLQNPAFEFRTENWNATAGTTPPLDVFAVLTQPLELGGRRAMRRQLAIAESGVAAGNLARIDQEVTRDTIRAYVAALRARAIVATLSAHREGLATLVASVARRVDEGYSAEADLLRFRTEAARIDGDLARARLDLSHALTALALAMGSSSAIEASQLREPAPVTIPRPDPPALASAVARLPGVLHATAAVERARQATALERTRTLPEPLISAGYKRTGGVNAMVAGMSLALPIFDRNHVSIATAVGQERAASVERDTLIQALTTEAVSLIGAAQAMATQAERMNAELLGPAEAVRRAAQASFREGTADVLKLIDAERIYADVQRAAVELRLDSLLTTLEARLAVGEEAIP